MGSQEKRPVDRINLDVLHPQRSSPEDAGAQLLPPRSVSPRPPMTAREKSGTFSNLTAYQDPPARRNFRTRTEGPPASNQRPMKDQPSRLDKKWGLVGDMPFQDLLWICEQSFRKESAALGKEILAIARSEFTNVTDSLLHDIRQPVEALSDEIVPKITKIQQEVEATAKVDWEPMHEGFRAQQDRVESLERQFTEEMSLLRSEIQDLQQQHEKASGELSERLGGLKTETGEIREELVRRSDRQVTQVLNVQQSLSAETLLLSNGVKELHQEFRSTHDEMFPRMEKQFKRYVKEEPVHVNFDPVLGFFGKSTEVMQENMSDLLGEMHTIKRELHYELTNKFEEQQRAVDVRLVQIEDMSKEVSGNKLRESWAQTEPPPTTERSAQTDGKVLVTKKLGGRDEAERPSQVAADADRDAEEKRREKDRKKILTDGEAMKRRARQALMKPQYNVAHFYHETGCAQAIAQHWIFEYCSFCVIFANAIWIAVDVDNNDAALLIEAAPVFQAVEHLFCTFFTLELSIRFLAFKFKRHFFRDPWCTFDLILVSAMIVETWVITVVCLAAGTACSSGFGDVSIVRMFRLVKMVRLSRMAKLLRAIPELLVLMKAVGAAIRSMAIFFLLWLIVIYVFAVAFRQLSEGQPLGNNGFQTVPNAMNTLLLRGVLPESANFLTLVTEEHPLYWPLTMAFICLAGICLMYMLIGVLTEVIRMVAAAEKEGMVVSMVAGRLRTALQNLGRDEKTPLSKMDFQELLVQPEVANLCQDVGVNVVVLVDMSDVIFEALEKEGKGMTFENLVEVVLGMRGTNPATVKDMKEMLRAVKGLVQDAHAGVLQKMNRGFDNLASQMKDLRKMVDADDDSTG
mmetsp:Transcript_113770/g.332285  ORF Transcript_113770/g.332285 Transcript_113770/m.332285 type:complete len:857 (-) Transcript_113770:89-2659(-)